MVPWRPRGAADVGQTARVSDVRVRGLTKRYSRRGPVVLAGVDLHLAAGTITQLRGSNGSGKSTLLRVLAGVTAATSGSVEGVVGPVGLVPERFPSDLRHTPDQYLGWLGRVRGLEPSQVREQVDVLAEALGLPAVARGEPLRRLSKGTTQKVAVLAAMLPGSWLLVLDEAWTGLDAEAQAALTSLVRRRRSDGSVIVLADHGGRAAGLQPDAVHRLDGGRLRAEVGGDRVRVELVGEARDRRPLETPGVLAVDLTTDGAVVVVAAEQSDALLVAVLAAGWSVRSVGPG
jgi:ABC-type multidrug transport system ATPase subunit